MANVTFDLVDFAGRALSNVTASIEQTGDWVNDSGTLVVGAQKTAIAVGETVVLRPGTYALRIGGLGPHAPYTSQTGYQSPQTFEVPDNDSTYKIAELLTIPAGTTAPPFVTSLAADDTTIAVSGSTGIVKLSAGATMATKSYVQARNAINVLDYGASVDAADNSTAFAAAAAALPSLTDQEGYPNGTLIIPPGEYKFTSPWTLPDWQGQCVVFVEGRGAVLTAAANINLIDRMPANQTEAETLVGAKIIFNGVHFRGTGSATSGIRLACTYQARFQSCEFNSIALDLQFCLQPEFANSMFIYAPVRLRTGTWTNATTGNSQSNHASFHACRFYAATAAAYCVSIEASSRPLFDHCIFEGLNPVRDIVWDTVTTAALGGIEIRNTHVEHAPTGAFLHVAHATNGIVTIDGLYSPQGPILTFSEADGVAVNILNVPYTVDMPGTAFDLGGASNIAFNFENWGGTSEADAGCNPRLAKWWTGGSAPTKLITSRAGTIDGTHYLHSPNGTRYKIAVANDGTLSAAAE